MDHPDQSGARAAALDPCYRRHGRQTRHPILCRGREGPVQDKKPVCITPMPGFRHDMLVVHIVGMLPCKGCSHSTHVVNKLHALHYVPIYMLANFNYPDGSICLICKTSCGVIWGFRQRILVERSLLLRELVARMTGRGQATVGDGSSSL